MKRQKGWQAALAVIAVCELSGCAAHSAVTPEEVDAVLKSSPASTVGISHFPVPFIYADWEKPVVERYGRMSLAQYNEHLYEDLPPEKDENAPVPVNSKLDEILKIDKTHAQDVIQAALTKQTIDPKWSVISGSRQVKSDAFIPALEEISRNSPNDTDRAFAYRELAAYTAPGVTQALEAGLFDDNASIVLLDSDLLLKLGDEVGGAVLVLPDTPLNPFHYYFLEQALKRVLPDANPSDFFRLSVEERRKLIEKAHPALLKKYLDLALQSKNRPGAAMVIYLLGDKEQAGAALDTLSNVLLEQGKYPDEFHSKRFWLRGRIIQAFQSGSQDRSAILAKKFQEELPKYSKAHEFLLEALCYAFQNNPNPQVTADLAKIRSIKTDNYDLYTGAALALASAGSAEAFPSFLHILSLKREPFCTVSMQKLEEITGVTTPGKPTDYGLLHNIGIPEERLDTVKVHAFWSKWYQDHKAKLRYDSAKQIFVW